MVATVAEHGQMEWRGGKIMQMSDSSAGV